MMNICLVSIVCNSASFVRPALRSFLPHVDCFVVCDTGSEDETVRAVQEETAGYDGCVLAHPFLDYSHNRNWTLAEAERRYPNSYYVMMDETSVLENGYAFRSQLRGGRAEAYSVIVSREDRTCAEARVGRAGMRYEYRVHERLAVEKAEILDGVRFLERSRAPYFEQELLKLDLRDRPTDPRPMYYAARMLYAQGRKEEAGKWFVKRLLAGGDPKESYQSMMFIVFLAEDRGADLAERVKLYLGIHRHHPTYAEPLYFAAMGMLDLGRRGEAVSILESAYEIPFRAHLGANPLIYRESIPKALCDAYFRTDTDKCVSWLYRHYTKSGRPFDFQYESYLRHLHRIRPLVPFMHPVVVYRHRLSVAELEAYLAFPSLSFSEEDLQSYREVVTNYSIPHVVVLDRIDRIPFFPSVGSVHLMVHTALSGVLEPFPSLRSVVGRDAVHAKRLRFSLPAHAHAHLVSIQEWRRLIHPERE